MPVIAPSAYLEKLNPEQRIAVEHGDDGDARPLLILAGAGSGRDPRRSPDLILADEDPISLELEQGIAALQLAGITPMRGHAAAI